MMPGRFFRWGLNRAYNKTVMLVGGGLGNAVLFSIGKAMRAAGDRVVYFAGYKHDYDVFKVVDIEAAADVIIWSVDLSEGVKPLPTNSATRFELRREYSGKHRTSC